MTDSFTVTNDTIPGATVLTLTAPRVNALSADLARALTEAVHATVPDGQPVLVIRSARGAFCAGLDLSGLSDATDESLGAHLRAIDDLLAAVRLDPRLTIAAVTGPAIGAGADLVAACDIRVGAPDAVRMRFPGILFGIVLGTDRFVELAGAAAHDVLVSGAQVDGRQALQLGLLTHGASDVDAEVSRIATDFAALPAPARAGLVAVLRDPARVRRARALLDDSLAVPGLADRIRDYASGRAT